MEDQRKIFYGYRLTSLQIYYYLPDYTSILNEFFWQTYDIHPTFPRVHQFLGYWKENIQATINNIVVVQQTDIGPKQIRTASFCGYLQ
ncbi:MAG: hypothetical protein HC836_32820 [Richelia sp. RM2_1_2]|nr:hypothetical protein [Richelia sp. RM2_1_2]